MDKSEFPEKAYEVFANHELLSNGYGIYIPSQQKEKTLGYDALWHLKGTRFKAIALQYKIVSQYRRPPKMLSTPCFKFDLHKSAGGYEQHNIMVARHTHTRFPILAVYCVPTFVEYKKLYEHLRNGTIFDNSRLLIPLKQISDSSYHYIAFDDTQALQFSKDPVSVENRHLDQIFESVEPIPSDYFTANRSNRRNEALEELDAYLLDTQSMLITKMIDE